MGRENAEPHALELVIALCSALDQASIRYCHWKSNEAIGRSERGENDLDLLIERADAARLGEVLHRLGFKQARPDTSREVPGLIDHYGLDTGSGRLVHLQAHYQLVLGDDMTKNYRLPVERAYLEHDGPPGLIRIPPSDFELAIFVVRMVLKHATWDAQLCLLGRLSASEKRERDHLFALVPESDRLPALAAHLPFLSPDVARRCLAALTDQPSRLARAATGHALERDLAIYARGPWSLDVGRRIVRRFLRGSRHVVKVPSRKRLVEGGVIVAVIGPDASTVTSVVDGLSSWLDGSISTHRFRFDPDSSSSADVATYRTALRHASNGGISLCDQFPPDRSRPDITVLVDASDAERPLDDLVGDARRHIWSRL